MFAASRLVKSLARASLAAGKTSHTTVIAMTTPRRMSSFVTDSKLIALNDLHNVPGAKPPKRRVGRGTGSGRGKLCRFGHQKSRSTPRAFEGGQTPMYRRLPKIGFYNVNTRNLTPLNLYKIQQFIDMGRLKVRPDGLTTMRDLLEAGVVSSVKEGVKLLSKGGGVFRSPIHLEVPFASASAIKAVEKAGGTVTCVHFNKLSLRALIKPYKFQLFPQRARPPPRILSYYLDGQRCGYMSPEIQIRNLRLFGAVTSEEELREEHANYMNFMIAQLRKQREQELGSKENFLQKIAEGQARLSPRKQ